MTEWVLGNDRLVLYLEDDKSLREDTTRLLIKKGYRVLGAATSEDAISLLEQSGADISLILSDHNLGGGETSGSFLKRAVDLYPNIPRILTSSSPTETIKDDFEQHGLNLSHVVLSPKGMSAIKNLKNALSQIFPSSETPPPASL